MSSLSETIKPEEVEKQTICIDDSYFFLNWDTH